MKILLTIDDTDDLESPGTGHLAAAIGDFVRASGWGEPCYVTRHQLLVHPDIPYTSHNSSMCLGLEVRPDALDEVIDGAARFLTRHSAPRSDPGLCVAVPERMAGTKPLIEFGRRAKELVIAKSEAYLVARRMGVHLSEHGGTGLGVIGALAGTGLRLDGNDGRLRGRVAIPAGVESLTVRDLRAYPEVDAVCDDEGREIPDGVEVLLAPKVKSVMRGGRAVVLVTASAEGAIPWRTRTIPELRGY